MRKLSPAHRKKIAEGVRRTIKLRRKRRTDAEIAADSPWERPGVRRLRGSRRIVPAHMDVSADGKKLVERAGIWLMGSGQIAFVPKGESIDKAVAARFAVPVAVLGASHAVGRPVAP